MEPRTLGCRTDLMLLAFRGEVVDRGEYLVARSPAQPSYFWGNLLVFPEAPGEGDLERWTGLFAAEFAEHPEVRHQTFQWDDPTAAPGVKEPFEAAGFRFEVEVVLRARSVRPPPRPNPDLVVRPLEGDADWAAALVSQVETCPEEHDPEGWARFKTRSMEEHRANVEAGRGLWFGAFLDGELVGDLGLYVQGGLGRFQTVGTRPAFRRRGVCGTLVHRSGQHALDAMGAETLVMAADPEYHAARIYESVGFEPAERLAGLCRWPGGV